MPGLGEEEGLDATRIGALAAGFFWVYSLSAVSIGRLADRIGARLLVGLGLVGSGIMNFLFVLSIENFALSLVFWSANGIFQAMGWTPLIGAVGRWVTEKGAGRVTASFGSCFVAGTALTFALGGFIVERGGVEAVFIAAATVLIPVGIAWWIGVRDPMPRSSDTEDPGGSIGPALWLLPPAAGVGAAYVAVRMWGVPFGGCFRCAAGGGVVTLMLVDPVWCLSCDLSDTDLQQCLAYRAGLIRSLSTPWGV